MTDPSEIYAANAQAHDYWASQHDRNVAYIRRPRTRRYYWKLLRDAVGDGPTKWVGARVLELGCGTGTYTDYCLAAGAAAYTGVDLSEKMLGVARAKFRQPGVTFVRAALEDFAKGATEGYDIIFSFSFLHHLPDVAAGLAGIRAMLAPQGVYVALHEVNNQRSLTRLEKLDSQLEIIAGLSGYYAVPLYQRLAVVAFKSYDTTWGGAFVSRVLRKTRRELGLYNLVVVPGSHKNGENLVDYQLNKPFCLMDATGAAGEVRPYCFLSFPELMVLGRPLNHEMLVMRKSR